MIIEDIVKDIITTNIPDSLIKPLKLIRAH